MRVVTYNAITRIKRTMKILFSVPVFFLLYVTAKAYIYIWFLNQIFWLRLRIMTTEAAPDKSRTMHK